MGSAKWAYECPLSIGKWAVARQSCRLYMAEAEAAALEQLAAVFKLPGTAPKVSMLQLLGELGLDATQRELESSSLRGREWPVSVLEEGSVRGKTQLLMG